MVHSEKLLNMKIFLSIIILIFSFQSLSKAEDVMDFEIEGMSIGDSLLEYMEENKIIEEINNDTISYYYKNDYVSISTWDIKKNFKIYDDVGVILKINDNKYEIYGLEGTLYMKENTDIKECYEKQNKITNDINNSFNLNIEPVTYFIPKKQLKPHNTSTKIIDFELSSGGVIRTICFEIKPGVKKNSDLNLLYVVVNSPIFWKYLLLN